MTYTSHDPNWVHLTTFTSQPYFQFPDKQLPVDPSILVQAFLKATSYFIVRIAPYRTPLTYNINNSLQNPSKAKWAAMTTIEVKEKMTKEMPRHDAPYVILHASHQIAHTCSISADSIL